MRVYFVVELDQYRRISEPDLPYVSERERSELAGMSAFKGDLVLVSDERTEVHISDVLEAWVQNLCFGAVPTILAGQPGEILYFSSPGSIHLEPLGSRVRVSGDYVAGAEFSSRSLAGALYQCGDRFLRWAREAKKSDASYHANLDYIETFRLPAAVALEAAGLNPGEEQA